MIPRSDCHISDFTCSIHACPAAGHPTQEEAFLKRYLEYCRSRSAPVLSETAGRVLANEYVELREEVRRFPSSKHISRAYPSCMTRQLRKPLAANAAPPEEHSL